jgi:TetR/AcrR family tetracycline transcriptional repressor
VTTPQRTDRDPLDRERVVRAAIELLDRVGLDGLTLRTLAAELGVRAPALYWHFKNKDELLQQMAEMIATEDGPIARPAEDEPWYEWLAEQARALRRTLNRHRDGAMLIASTRPAPSQFAGIELQLEVLEAAGIGPADAMRVSIVLGNFVSGFTLDEQVERMRDDGVPIEEDWAEAMTALAEYPRVLEALRVIGDPQSDKAFEDGLALIIDGVRARAQRPGEADGSTGRRP